MFGSILEQAASINQQIPTVRSFTHKQAQNLYDFTAAMESAALPNSHFIKHPNGQVSHCVIDDFTDPWKPAEVILIQHGFGRNYAFWYHWVPVLASKYKVIRRDLRGHGLSSTPTGEYGLEELLEEIVDILDQLGLDKVHFVGESTSGMLGEALAARYPARLHSLITCSAPSHLPEQALKLFAFGYEDWPSAVLKLGSRGWATALSKVPGTVDGTPQYTKWWVDQVARSTSLGMSGYARFLSKLDARPLLPEVAVKTLILAPSQSAATKLEEQQWIQSQIPGAELVIIEAPGHEIYVQNPHDCQKALLDFLERLSGST